MNNKLYLLMFAILAAVILGSGIVSANSCYQESVNVSNQSGIDGSCGLRYTGRYLDNSGVWNDLGSLFDGNFNTYGFTGGTGGEFLYINYTKPTSNFTSAVWKIAYIDLDAANKNINLSISTTCFNQNANTLLLRIKSPANFGSPITGTYDCYNGTWVSLFTYNGTGIYEEAIFWNNVTSNDYTITFPYANNAYTKNSTLTYGFTTVDTFYNYTLYSISSLDNTLVSTCFQESANTTNQVGTDGNCGLRYNGSYIITGNFSSFYTSSNYYDGNYFTATQANSTGSSTTGTIFINYTKPANSLSSSKWLLWRAGSYESEDISDCWNAYTDVISFKSVFIFTGAEGYSEQYCFNGVSWVYKETFGDSSSEESMVWYLNKTSITTSNKTISFQLSDGKYYYDLTTYNTLGNSNYFDPNITIDTTNPLVSYITATPTNNSLLNTTNLLVVNLSIIETNYNATQIRLYDYLYNLISTNTSNTTTFTGLFDGTYYFNATVTDLAGNINNTETRQVLIDYTRDNIQFFAQQRITNATLIYNVTLNGSNNYLLTSDGVSKTLISSGAIGYGTYNVTISSGDNYNCTYLNWVAINNYNFTPCELYNSLVNFYTYNGYTNASVLGSNTTINYGLYSETVNAPTTNATMQLIKGLSFIQITTNPNYISKTNSFSPSTTYQIVNTSLSQTSITFNIYTLFGSILLSGVNVSIKDIATGVTFYTNTGIFTVDPSSGQKNWTFSATNFATQNVTTTQLNATTGSYSVYLVPALNVTLYDEKASAINLTLFNLSNPTSIYQSLYCTNQTYQTLIPNTTVGSFTVSPPCAVSKIKYILNYLNIDGSTTTYDRTLIVADISGFSSTNVRIFIPDLKTTNMYTTALKPYDIFGIYTVEEYTRVLVYKNMPTGIELINSDFIDAQGQSQVYLIQNDGYTLTVFSDNAPLRVLGPFTSTSEGIKILRLFDVVLTSTDTPTSGQIFAGTTIDTTNAVTANTSTLHMNYLDPTNTTTSLHIQLYNGTCVTPLGGPLYDQTFTSATLNNTAYTVYYTYNIIGSPYQSGTSNINFCSKYTYVVGGITYAFNQTTTYDNFIPVTAKFKSPWTFQWIIFLILLVIALSLNSRTVSYGSLLITGLGVVLYSWNWIASGSVPGVRMAAVFGICLLIAIILNVKRQM